MATTSTWLQQENATRLALSLLFEGVDLGYTTADTASEMATAYAATDWTNFKSHLNIVGETASEINLFDPKITPNTVTFVVTDVDGTFIDKFLYNDGNGNKTRLTARYGAGATTAITAKSTTGFASSGDIYIGHERIGYTSTTATTFAGTITRGKNSLYQTNGGSDFGKAHEIGDFDSSAYAPAVTDEPAVWYNRRVQLRAHHWENDAWSTAANAKKVWTGRIKSWADRGNGQFEIQCVSIHEELFSSVFNLPWRARLKPGMRIHDRNNQLIIFGYEGGTEYNYQTTDLSTGVELSYTDIVSNINLGIKNGRTGASITATHNWSVGIRETTAGPRFFVRVKKTSGTFAVGDTFFFLGLHTEVVRNLGFPVQYTPEESNESLLTGAGGIGPVNEDGTQTIQLGKVDSTTFELEAPAGPLYLSPISSSFNADSLFRVYYEDDENTWETQDHIHPDHDGDADTGAEGFIDVDGAVFSCKNVTASDYMEIVSIVRANQKDKGLRRKVDTSIGANGTPVMQQIWLERDSAGQILLRLMLSTGNNAYNHAQHDIFPATVGMGIPASMVDINSFMDLDMPFELDLREPEPFRAILESALAASGRYMIVKDGKFAITPPGFEVENAPTVISLSEDDKASPGDISTIEYSTSGLINRVTLENDASEAFRDATSSKITVQSVGTISEYGQQKSVKIKSKGLIDTSAFVDYVATPALAYFSRPLALLSRTINYTKIHLVPGDIIKVTDDRVVNPHSGSRGLSGLAAWVRKVGFNWATGVGHTELAFLPDHPVSFYATWGPTAQVDEGAANGGLDAGTSSVFTLHEHKFSHSSDSKDIEGFSDGDQIRILEYSPASGATPVEWTREIQTVNTGADTITVTAAIGTPAWDSTKKYLIIFDDKSNVDSSQKTKAYMADDADDSTGDAANDANLWAANYKAAMIPESDWGELDMYENGTEQLFARPHSTYWGKGEPMSAGVMWSLIRNIHNINNYKTRQCLVNMMRESDATHATTTKKLVFGPCVVPLNGIDRTLSGNQYDSLRRALTGYFFIKTSNASNACTVYITTAEKACTGSSTEDVTYLGRKRTYSTTSTSTSLEWVSIADIDPVVTSGTGQCLTWITIEIDNASTDTSTFTGFSLHEGVFSY